MNFRQICPAFLLIFFLAGCGDSQPNSVNNFPQDVEGLTEIEPSDQDSNSNVVSTAVADANPESEILDTPLPLDTPSVPAAEPGQANDLDQLESQIDAEIKNETGAELAYGGFETVEIQPVQLSDGTQLWTVYTVGFRPFDPVQNHFVRLYKHESDQWQELGEVRLEFPDILFPKSVSTLVENGRLWLAVDSGVGAHGGCFDLLLWDGQALTSSVSHCHSSPGAGQLTDLNGDGFIDVLLENGNDYIFCYACGVRLPDFEVRTFNDSFWETVTLTTISEGSSEEIALNNEAVALANAGLWQDASATISQLNSLDPTILWNETLITLYEQAHLELISSGIFPLLQTVYYGDYDTPIELMNGYSAEQIFSASKNPLIVGTPAEGYEDVISAELISATEAALSVKPDLAAAHFLHGWSTYLTDPAHPDIVRDIQEAITLAPNQPLYQESLAFLSGG